MSPVLIVFHRVALVLRFTVFLVLVRLRLPLRLTRRARQPQRPQLRMRSRRIKGQQKQRIAVAKALQRPTNTPDLVAGLQRDSVYTCLHLRAGKHAGLPPATSLPPHLPPPPHAVCTSHLPDIVLQRPPTGHRSTAPPAGSSRSAARSAPRHRTARRRRARGPRRAEHSNDEDLVRADPWWFWMVLGSFCCYELL